MEYVWIRLGDVAEYEKFDSPYDAGLKVKSVLAPFIPEAFYYRAAGVSVPPKFVGLNYISLFWGDEDAQWIRDLTEEEKRDFERGVTGKESYYWTAINKDTGEIAEFDAPYTTSQQALQEGKDFVSETWRKGDTALIEVWRQPHRYSEKLQIQAVTSKVITVSSSKAQVSSSQETRLSRDDVRVEVWEERDRLHIGIQNKETGEYLASWWDDEAREMFEQGFFKHGRGLEESVLSYAEETGILQ